MSGRGGIVASRMMALPPRASERTGPEPTLLEGIGASFRAASQDELAGAREKEALDEALAPIVEELARRRIDGQYASRSIRDAFALRYDEGAIWQGVAAARAADPKAFADLPATPAEYRAAVTAPVRARAAEASEVAARAGGTANLIGALGYGATDPINIVTAPIGIAQTKTVAQAVVAGALLNARIEAVNQPVVAMERRARGQDYTSAEGLANIGIAAGAGGVLTGLGKGLELALPRVSEAIGGVADRLPAPLRERMAAAATPGDADLADAIEAVVGRDGLSADEAAAATVLRRQAFDQGDNPFVEDGAGVAAHGEKLADAMNAILADAPPPKPARARALESTALTSGTVPVPSGIEGFKRAIGRAESPNDYAKNPVSSAQGRYQFTRGTFLRYYKKRFGTQGLSNDQIHARVTDGDLQEVLMDDLIADNVRVLDDIGAAPTVGNLYVMHFAGEGGGRKLLTAAPDTPVRAALGNAAVNKNPFLEGMTAAEAIAELHRRVGTPPGEAPLRARAATSETDRLRGEIDALEAERTALAMATGAEPGKALDEAMAAPAQAGTPTISDIPAPRLKPIAEGFDPMSYLDRLTDYAGTRGNKLTAEAIGRALALDEAQASQVIRTMAMQPKSPIILTQDRPAKIGRDGTVVRPAYTGRIIRRPTPPRKPQTLLDFIAARGGIDDVDGVFNAMALDKWHYTEAKVRDRKTGETRLRKQTVPGRRQLIRPPTFDDGPTLIGGGGGQKYENTPDALFQVAIDQGYFPELAHLRVDGGSYDDLPDLSVFYGAIESEMRGSPRYRIDDRGELEGVRVAADDVDEMAYHIDSLATEWGLELDPATLADAAARLGGHGNVERALRDAIEAAAYRDLDEYGATVPDDYARNDGRNWTDEIDYDERGAAGRGDRIDGEGLGRSASDAEDAREGRAEPAQPEEAAGLGRGGEPLDEPAPPVDPATIAQFADPDSHAAAAQADSIEHDLRAALDRGAAIDPAIADRRRQETGLRAGAPLRNAAEQDGTIGLGLFDAADQPDLLGEIRAIVDEIDDEAAAIKNVRDCL